MDNYQMVDYYTTNELNILSSCTLCPRECNADRLSGRKGYCGIDSGMNIASICIHRGEEPAISGHSGICNIFFAGCNLRCLYCQNHEISRVKAKPQFNQYSFNDALDEVEKILAEGIHAVGFVSPSHMIPQMKSLIRGLHNRGLKPVMVYNTNGYDKAEIIDSLDGLIDIYLPDFKYVSSSLSIKFSDSEDYPDVALRAIKRMYYQKGSRLITDSKGRAENGLLIRHLVLPDHAVESKNVLRTIAEEISTGVSISLMSQYHPVPSTEKMNDLGRSLYYEEYEEVVREMELLGFRNGWHQEIGSNISYRPDFSRDHPFEPVL